MYLADLEISKVLEDR